METPRVQAEMAAQFFRSKHTSEAVSSFELYRATTQAEPGVERERTITPTLKA